jgi:hypothetical protein
MIRSSAKDIFEHSSLGCEKNLLQSENHFHKKNNILWYKERVTNNPAGHCCWHYSREQKNNKLEIKA